MRGDRNRRELLRDFFGIGVAVTSAPLVAEAVQASAKGNEKEPEVTATEDLMREHGVIRRALLVYFESVPKLRQSPSSLDPAALHRTAELFRTFGEDYHERMLEEQHVFPVVRKQGPEAPDGDFQPVEGDPVPRGQRACLFQHIFHGRFYGYDCHLQPPSHWML